MCESCMVQKQGNKLVYSTAKVELDRILQINSPTFANKEAYLQNVRPLVVGSHQTPLYQYLPCFLAFAPLIVKKQSPKWLTREFQLSAALYNLPIKVHKIVN